MTDTAARWANVADRFTERARAVPAGAWDNPAPCEGWVARDVVRHLVEWMPGLFFDSFGLDRPDLPPVDEDPVAAWVALDGAVRAVLADPEAVAREHDNPMGRTTLEQAVAMAGVGDVLVHTWDLARAAGLDESLDPEEVHLLYEGMEGMEEPMRASGHFGPRVEVPDDADEQTRLLAFTGRHP